MTDACECEEVKCPEGIPAWVMTFADLMSLLLAFFVLLFSFSEMDKNIYKELAGSLKDAFGVQREIKAKETPRGINIIAREFSPGRPMETPINEVRQVTTDENRLHPVFTDPSKDGQENMDKKTKDAEDNEYNAMAPTLSEEELLKRLPHLDEKALEKIKKDAEKIREALKDEIQSGLIQVNVRQKRIILRIREKGSFPSGSATLISPFSSVTKKIGDVFGDFTGMIVVSGHTDNIPIRTDRYRSNWELSASRAVSVIHALRWNSALQNKKFEIAAYADTQPVDTNSTYLGRAKNRRVEITLDYSNDPSLMPVMKDLNGENVPAPATQGAADAAATDSNEVPDQLSAITGEQGVNDTGLSPDNPLNNR